MSPNWWGVGLIWVGIAAIAVWSVRRQQRHDDRDLMELNAELPETIRFTSEGVAWQRPDGARRMLPWRDFVRWREGRRVVVLDLAGTRPKPAIVLSLARMSDIERQFVRDLLRSYIPPSDARARRHGATR